MWLKFPQSDTCSLLIPELELEVGPATLGGRFTTVEGLLVNVKEQLDTQGAMMSDSAEEKSKLQFDKFLQKLDSAIGGKLPFTLILDDPAGNSFVQVGMGLRFFLFFFPNGEKEFVSKIARSQIGAIGVLPISDSAIILCIFVIFSVT